MAVRWVLLAQPEAASSGKHDDFATTTVTNGHPRKYPQKFIYLPQRSRRDGAVPAIAEHHCAAAVPCQMTGRGRRCPSGTLKRVGGGGRQHGGGTMMMSPEVGDLATDGPAVDEDGPLNCYFHRQRPPQPLRLLQESGRFHPIRVMQPELSYPKEPPWIGVSRAGPILPCCGGCRAPHCLMRSARSLRHSCRKPPDSPRFFTCVFEASGAAFLAARTRLPLFLACLVPRFSDTRPFPLGFGPSGVAPWGRRAHACSGAPGVPRGEYVVGEEELLLGDREGQTRYQKTTFSIVNPLAKPDRRRARWVPRTPPPTCPSSSLAPPLAVSIPQSTYDPPRGIVRLTLPNHAWLCHQPRRGESLQAPSSPATSARSIRALRQRCRAHRCGRPRPG